MKGTLLGTSNGLKVVSYGRIGDDDVSVEKTLALARRYVLEDVSSPIVQDVVQIIRKHHQRDVMQIKAAFDFVVRNVPYRHDRISVVKALLGNYDEKNGVEIVTRPRFTLARIMEGEDCDGQTAALSCILTALQFTNYFKVIAWKTESEFLAAGNPFTHVYNMCAIPSANAVIPLDIVMGYEGFNSEKKPTIREKIYRVN